MPHLAEQLRLEAARRPSTMRFLPVCSFAALSLFALQGAHAQNLTLLDQFDPNQGTLVGVGFDRVTDSVWIHGSSAATIRGYTRGGSFVNQVNRPGESTNDADVTFASTTFTLGSTVVPLGTMLFVNGETGTADAYAQNIGGGFVLGSLTTQFGTNHVVGMGYHAARNSLFLVADKLDPNTPNTIAEVSATTGQVLNTFGTGSADFTVNYGDIEVVPGKGTLLLVSSDENRVRELTPTGEIVRDWTLPSGVSSVSGIGIDALRNEAFLSGTNGIVWRIGNVVPAPSSLVMGLVGAIPGVCFVLRRRLKNAR
jgi:hypothetical protein